MNLLPIKYKIKCDVGGCAKNAEYRLQTDETGTHSGVHLCAHCAGEIRRAFEKELGKGKSK